MTVTVVPTNNTVPIPDIGAINAWYAKAEKQNTYNIDIIGQPPAGYDAGHYQRIQLNTRTREIAFVCDDWRTPRDDRCYSNTTDQHFRPSSDKPVAEIIYWVIDSGVKELPYLTNREGDALAAEVAPHAETLLDNLVPVPGTDTLDWSIPAARAGQAIAGLVSRDRNRNGRIRHRYIDMADVADHYPEIIDKLANKWRRWADCTDDEIDDEIETVARCLVSWYPEVRDLADGDDGSFFDTTLGVRAFIYGYRAAKADGRRPMDADQYFTDYFTDVAPCSPNDTDARLDELAARYEREAADNGVHLCGCRKFLTNYRAVAREAVRQRLEGDVGPRTRQAEREFAALRAERAALVSQIASWWDRDDLNVADLARRACMSRQGMDQLLKRLFGDGDEG